MYCIFVMVPLPAPPTQKELFLEKARRLPILIRTPLPCSQIIKYFMTVSLPQYVITYFILFNYEFYINNVLSIPSMFYIKYIKYRHSTLIILIT